MKKDIHPKYDKAKVECACGYNFETRSTVPNIKVDICSQCHPFFTGKQKLVDAAGRVDKFKARVEAAQKAKEKKEAGSPSFSPRINTNQKAKESQDEIKEIKEELKENTQNLKKEQGTEIPKKEPGTESTEEK